MAEQPTLRARPMRAKNCWPSTNESGADCLITGPKQLPRHTPELRPVHELQVGKSYVGNLQFVGLSGKKKRKEPEVSSQMTSS